MQPLVTLALASWCAVASTGWAASRQPPFSAADPLPRAKLPAALRDRDLNRLSAGAYAALLAEVAADAKDPARVPTAAGAAGKRRVALASLDPRLGPNLRLGEDPPQLPTNRLAQAEPHLIRSFTNPNLFAATFQEGRFLDGGAVDCGYAISLDGGRNWNRGLIPHVIDSVDGGAYRRASDPVAGLDLADTVCLSVLGLKGSPPNFYGGVLLSKSSDGGRSFDAPLVAFSTPDPSSFPDKPWLAINTFPNTPTAGRIATTFTYYTSTNVDGFVRSVEPIMLTYSDDGGRHWSAPRRVSGWVCQGSQPMFLPDGSLAVLYWNFTGDQGDQIEVVVSPDGGASFGPPLVVTPVTVYSDPVARAWGFLPSATTDRQAGVLYVTYQALEWQGASATPHVMFTKSVDRGRTWSAPVAINDTPGGAGVFNPAIAAAPDGQHVTVVFYDKRHDDGSENLVDFYLAESFDGGDTWLPNVRVSEVSSDLALAPLTPGGRMVGDYHGIVPALNLEVPGMAIWIDTRTGSPDPFVGAIRRLRGTTFEAWRRLKFARAALNDPSISGEQADPDGDGIPNLLEYALGLEPTRRDLPLHLAKGVVANPDRAFALSFERLAVLGDVQFLWRASADLRQWETVTPASQLVLPGLTPVVGRLQAAFPLGDAPHRFFRLGASRTPP